MIYRIDNLLLQQNFNEINIWEMYYNFFLVSTYSFFNEVSFYKTFCFHSKFVECLLSDTLKI